LAVPIIAIFNGIIIQMFFEDHGPPHIHALYSGAKALVRISRWRSDQGETSPETGKIGKRLGRAKAV
jgi:hypothetical protein